MKEPKMMHPITDTHRAMFAHLLDDADDLVDSCIVPAALAGHFPHTDIRTNLRIAWTGAFDAFPNPADPTRLVVTVFADQVAHNGLMLVGLDHIAHLDCYHPHCQTVIMSRRRELDQVPDDGGVFALCTVDGSDIWYGPKDYLIHIDDYHAAVAAHWNGRVSEHTELASWWDRGSAERVPAVGPRRYLHG